MKLSKNALIAQNTTNKAVKICHGSNWDGHSIDVETGSISAIISMYFHPQTFRIFCFIRFAVSFQMAKVQ